MKKTIKHSETKSAWNIIGTAGGEKYKLASVPYTVGTDNDVLDSRYRKEALDLAKSISKHLNCTGFEKSEKTNDTIGDYTDDVKQVLKRAVECDFNYILTHSGFTNNLSLEVSVRKSIHNVAKILASSHKYIMMDGKVITPRYNSYNGITVLSGLEIYTLIKQTR